MTLSRCTACGSACWVTHPNFDVDICFFCESWACALDLLAQHSINPREVRHLFIGNPRITGITMEVARTAIEVFKTHDDEPN